MEKFHFECNGKHMPDVVSDYHPLTSASVEALLDGAVRLRDVSELSSIQVRLCQGIPGMTCPRPVSGEVASKMLELDGAFVEYIRARSSTFDACAAKIRALVL